MTQLAECTPLTTDWLAECMQKHFGEKPAVTKVAPLGEDSGPGYMSAIRRVHLEWKEKTGPSTVIVKVPSTGMAADAWEAGGGGSRQDDHVAAVQKMMHETESHVYNYLANIESPLRRPAIYESMSTATGTPIIVMEDLAGTTYVDIAKGFTFEQMLQIIDQIVEMQIIAMTHDDWRGFVPEKTPEMLADFGDMIKGMGQKMLAEQGDKLALIDVVLRNFMSEPNALNRHQEMMKTHRFATLAHGDLWSPQILWRGNTLAGIVDWQLSRPASIMEDLQHCVYLCTPISVSSRIDELLQYYFSRLLQRAGEEGLVLDFGFDDVKSEFVHNIGMSATYAIFASAMWSNSDVLKRGDGKDEERINECHSRLNHIMKTAVDLLGWK